jgi:hypothetical protein
MNAGTLARLSVVGFESGRIDIDAFDHEAHVYVAWLYLAQYPPEEAADRFCAALRRLTEQLGQTGKYHETISRFFLQVIAERRDAAPADAWPAFRRKNEDLCSGAAAVLDRHYSRELLSSDRARAEFLTPDRRVA